ncbi:MAG: C-terminal binding protein [Candidatus Acidiferrales bacterium]
MKIVITDHRFPQVDHERRAVEEARWNLVVGQAGSEDQLIELCRDADGVLAGRALITERVLAAMKSCRIIVRYGIGVETIDIPAATNHGIMVANVPDYCIDEVSDHALTLLLMLSRQIVPAMALAAVEPWSIAKMPALHRLRGQVCGLFGFGRIGSLLASKIFQLGMYVVVYDPYLTESRAQELKIEPVSFESLLRRSDFISIHAPLNDETHQVFGEAAFQKMKDTVFIINAARGGLINEAALLAALNTGKIAGAALDVLDSETPTPAQAFLRNHPKVILTPHSAWLSQEARSNMQASAIAQVIACLKGETPYGLINRTVQPRGLRAC